ncbi:methyl-accepting chemotaxis protein [Saccharopolyspora lacisalsi]|uniref:Methyl-accepting chemotaxis protein n=1 Tax=Halosaccharopolyspora lacisalsi TaxID=1000566 RepID=A0A839E9E0_9PSEU|nr:hypothetical protein [Halosaccharopolyspora lacisalsi]MBA8827458.1 methyl-accepting chemotaxis protein [Halosaccharopolyspora lacisalsi]
MKIGIPKPGDVVATARSTFEWATDSAATVAAVPGRVIGLVDGAEDLLGRVREVVDRADELVERTSRTVDEAEGLLRTSRTVAASAEEAVTAAGRISGSAETVVARAGDISERASSTVDTAERISGTADSLLAAYEPAARRAAPMLEHFVGELSQQEVDAAIRLVDELPVLTEHVLTDILPILRTLDRVGPEIHELLEVTHDVRRAIVGLPGFRFFRRRGEDRVSEEETEDPETGHYDPPPGDRS